VWEKVKKGKGKTTELGKAGKDGGRESNFGSEER
jgi:hypothetical protein